MSKTPSATEPRYLSLSFTTVLLGTCCLLLTSGCQVASNGMNAQGARYFQQSQYNTAIRRFHDAREADPTNPDSYYNLGATYHQLAKVQNDENYSKQAEDYYNQCLDRDPNHAECYRGLAVFLVEQDRSDAAFRLLNHWTEISPGHPDARIELARLHNEFGDGDGEEEQLLAALEISPQSSRALTALGRRRELEGDFTQAYKNYSNSLVQNNQQPQVHARLASLRASGAVPTAVTPIGGTRVVTRPGSSSRY